MTDPAREAAEKAAETAFTEGHLYVHVPDGMDMTDAIIDNARRSLADDIEPIIREAIEAEREAFRRHVEKYFVLFPAATDRQREVQRGVLNWLYEFRNRSDSGEKPS